MSVTVHSASDQAAASIVEMMPGRYRMRDEIRRVVTAKEADRENAAALAEEALVNAMPCRDNIFCIIEEAMQEFNALRRPDPPPVSQADILACLAGWIHASVAGCPDEHCPAEMLAVKRWAARVQEKARRAGRGDYLRATFDLVVGEAAAV